MMRRIAAVLHKELLDNARDRRTLFSALLFGPLFGPALFAVLVNVMVARTVTSMDQPIEVPIVAAERAPNLVELLEARGIVATAETGVDDFDDAINAVEAGRQDLVVLIDQAFPDDFEHLGYGRVGLVYDQSNNRAQSKVARVRGVVLAYSQQIGALRLLARGLEPSVTAAILLDEFDVSTAAGRSVVLLGMLTYFLLLATLMGGFYLAIDATAGERERGSLEPLLSTPLTRTQILLGKIGATMCYMLLSLALTVAGFWVGLRFVPLESIGMSSGFDAAAAFTAFWIIVPFVPLGASFTKTYREAQTYLTLILLIPTLPLVFATMLNVKAAAKLMWIPSLSQHLLITSLIRQEAVPSLFYVQSAVSSLAVAAVVAWIAARCYQREALLG
jgi:sodium transport system permease protein